MKTMAISKFRTHALRVIEEVAETREELVITKRRKPIARVVPYAGDTGYPVPGRLADALVREIDIVTPLGPGSWEAAQ
ncbi:type II toxin-antitoxin system Phd/YefM family antitoxin [Candidatus Fermentibacteria bacterium]|nr:type II toxin-antitoxin system Phd/YefM family antitoxin [Candidatus Fermentibacteria bacterium]